MEFRRTCDATVEGGLDKSTPSENASPGQPRLAVWHGDAMLARSVRFALGIMVPIVFGLVSGAERWLAYALLTCILSYLMDMGGAALPRLAHVLFAGLVVVAGGLIGTAAAGHIAFVALALGTTAMLYGLVEGCHPSAASAARFLCLAVTVAALYTPIRGIDVAVVGASALFCWLLSIGWDLTTGLWRPSKAPTQNELADCLQTRRGERLIFAAVTASAVVGSFLLAHTLGLEHLNWAILALVLVLHADAEASWQMLRNLFLGTLLGVAVGWTYGTLLDRPLPLLIGMTIAAIVRWPVQQRNGALGQATMAIFIILLLQLTAHLTGHHSHAPQDRLIDISIGCGLAILALCANAAAQRLLLR
jgi:hypothetical protein